MSPDRAERSAAVSLLSRLNKIWIAVLMMLTLTAGVLLVGVLLLRTAREIRWFADQTKQTAQATQATAELINGCINPAGECAKRFAQQSTEQQQARLNAITDALEAGRQSILQEQQENAAKLLSEINKAVSQLNSLSVRNQDLERQIAALLAEVAVLRQIIEQSPPPVGSTVANSPPLPSSVTCSLLPPTLGVLVGCRYG